MRLNVLEIRLAMAEGQLTATALAQKAGMTRAGLYKILSRGTCRTVTAGKLASALSVPVGRIIEERKA